MTFIQLVNKFSDVMDSESSLPCLHKPVTATSPKALESDTFTLYLYNLISRRYIFFSLCAFLIFAMRTTCLAHLIFRVQQKQKWNLLTVQKTAIISK
jgi:hypothetical protein